VGFIPENPNDPIYISLIDVLKDVAEFLEDRGQSEDRAFGLRLDRKHP